MANDNIQWTSQQMIENASNWSLAGDVALLNSLKKFSEGLLSNTESVSAKVDNLLNSLENVSLKLELTKNEFQSLRNTQFIENRVYEDDETLDIDESKVEEKELTDEDKENAIKNAISRGLKVMEKYYDKVELAVSDSEGEGNDNSYVLQPKDPYAERTLPHLVGSQDWYKKWHVGLLPSDTESESENKEEDVYSSNSDSDEHLPKNRVLGSDTNSELDFSNRNTGPVANSTFNDSQDRRREVFHSSDESSEQSNFLPAKAPISNEKFAEELAAKLGDVISGKNETIENVTKPTERIRQPPHYGNLFADEPPPLDDLEDTVLPKSAHKGLFSTSGNLFAKDSENDLFWDSQKGKSEETKGTSESQKPTTTQNQSSSKPKGLFDNSESSSEEDMLTVTEKRRNMNAAVKNPYMQPYKTTVPFVDDQPPEIRPKTETKKKPVGGVSVLGGNTSLFAGKSMSEEQQHDRIHDLIKENKKIQVEQTKKSTKKTGLFDESSDEEMFITKAKNTEAKAVEQLPSASGSKKLRLFEDSDNFSELNPSKTLEEPKKKSLFEDDDKKEEHSKGSKILGLFDEDTYQNINIFRPTNKEITDRTENASTNTKKSAKKISLFDDDDDDFLKEEEDIFFAVPQKNTLFETSSTGLFDDLEESNKKPNQGNLESSNNENIDNRNKESMPKSDVKGIPTTTTSDKNFVKKHTKSLFEDFASPDNSDDDWFAPPKAPKKQEGLNIDTKTSSKNIKGSSANETVPRVEASKIKVEKSSIRATIAAEEKSSTDEDGLQGKTADDTCSVATGGIGSINNEDKTDEHETILSQTTENVGALSDVIITEDTKSHPSSKEKNEGFDVRSKDEHDLKQDKKEVLGKVRKTAGLFDSDSEKSLDEETFDKKNQIDTITSNNAGLTGGELLNAEREDILKPDEHIQDDKAEGKVPDIAPELSFVVPPPISLFDPTPPPVDWDATSDHSVESDTFSLTDGILDRTNYNQSQPTASSLFDEAPPSLDVNDLNYSSGIVRDINVTRVETDDSSFYPHASSSRRLSSDIFNDQQSQDSFFVTKNPPDSLGQVSSLDKISENSEEVTSKIENLTPSGNAGDFDELTSLFEKSENESNADMDRTKSITATKKPEILQRIPLYSGDVEHKTDNSFDRKPNVSAVRTSPGKLQHNLNINLGALLPGAAPPRSRPAVAKSVSLDETDSSTVTPEKQAILRPRPAIRIVRPKSESRREETEPSKDGDFENLSGTEVLHSVTKDRAKIQIKRRPSTRRARQEAVRRSMTDFSLYQDVEPSLHSEQPPSEGGSDLPKTTGVSMVFDKKQERQPDDVEKIPDEKVLFDSPTEELFKPSLTVEPKHDLFVSSSLLPNPDSKPISGSLFGDLNEETESVSKPVQKVEDISAFEASVDSFGSFTTRTSRVTVSSLENEEKQSGSLSFLEDLGEPRSIFETSPGDSGFFKSTAQTTVSSEVKKKGSIFDEEGSLSSSDENLFSSASRLPKTDKISSKTKPAIPVETLPKKPQKSGLFFDKSDSDSDSELFGDKPKQSTSQAEERKPVEPIKKTSIFDDSGDSSGDDLFGSKTTKASSASSKEVRGAVTSSRRVDIKTANIKKLENKEVTDFDPLSGFK